MARMPHCLDGWRYVEQSQLAEITFDVQFKKNDSYITPFYSEWVPGDNSQIKLTIYIVTIVRFPYFHTFFDADE